MYGGCEHQPEQGAHIFLLQSSGHREDSGESRQVPRVQILIHDVERCSRHRNGQERGDQTNAAPACDRILKKQAAQSPARKKQEKNRRYVPQKESGLEWQVSHSEGKRNQIREQRQAGMRQEEFLTYRKQFGMQDFLHPRQVDFSVFGEWMVSMHQKSARGKQRYS